MERRELGLIHDEEVREMLDGGQVKRREHVAILGTRWRRESDMHVHPAMVGDKGPMTGGCVTAEGGEVRRNLRKGSSGGFQDPRDKLEAMGVPGVGIVDAVTQAGDEGLLVGAHDAGILANVPLRESVSFALIHQTLKVGAGGEERKRDL